jgi:hypothetical protein
MVHSERELHQTSRTNWRRRAPRELIEVGKGWIKPDSRRRLGGGRRLTRFPAPTVQKPLLMSTRTSPTPPRDGRTSSPSVWSGTCERSRFTAAAAASDPIRPNSRHACWIGSRAAASGNLVDTHKGISYLWLMSKGRGLEGLRVREGARQYFPRSRLVAGRRPSHGSPQPLAPFPPLIYYSLHLIKNLTFN